MARAFVEGIARGAIRITDIVNAAKTPPAEMQGQWVEPLSGQQLQIDADGKIAWRYEGALYSANYKDNFSAFSFIGDWLCISTLGTTDHMGFSFGKYNNLFCRPGMDELRLRRWLKERGA